MRRKSLKEVFTKTSADILKACYKNAQRMGNVPSKETIAAEVEKQPVYKAMSYEDRSEIDDFLESLPSGPLQQLDFNTSVDRNMSTSVASMTSGPPQPLGPLSRPDLIESYLRSLPDSYLSALGASQRDFAPSQVGRGQVGGAYSAGSVAGLSHGMGPSVRTVTPGDSKTISSDINKTIGQTYTRQMDPKNRHVGRAFSDIRIPTGDRRFFSVTPKLVDETSNVYDVYLGELIPEEVFYRRSRVYGDLFSRKILPSIAEMQSIRNRRSRNESLIRKFVLEALLIDPSFNTVR